MIRKTAFRMLLFILFCFLPLCSALGAAEVSSETPAQAMASFHQEAAISGLGNVTVGTALEEPVVPPAPAELDEKDPHLVILSRRPDGGIGDYILFADDVTVLREKNGYRAKAAGVSAVGDVELARWEITGPDAGLLPGADVCFVPSDGSYPMLGTVESVQGTAITMTEGRTFIDEGAPDSLKQEILRRIYNKIKGFSIDKDAYIQHQKKDFSYLDAVDLHMTVDAHLKLKVYKDPLHGDAMVIYACLDYGISDLGGKLNAKNLSLKFDPVSIPLLGIPEIGPCFTIGVKLGVNGKGEFSSNLKDGRIEAKILIGPDGNGEAYADQKDPAFEIVQASGDLDFFAGMSAGCPFKVVVLGIGPSVNPGFHFKIGMCGNEGGNPSENKAADAKVNTWHMCEAGKCMNGGISYGLSWSFGVTLGMPPFSVTLWSFNVPIYDIGLWRYYHSFTYGDGDIIFDPHFDFLGFNPHSSDTICPHKAWRLDLKAVRQHDPGTVIPNTYIGLTEAPNYKGRKPTETSVKANSYFRTGADGKATLFLPAYTGFQIQAETGESSYRGVIGVNMEEKKAEKVIPVKYDQFWLTFHANTDRPVESMPQSPMSGYLGDTLPMIGISGFPKSEGMDFAGWSEDPDTKWYQSDRLYTLHQITMDRDYQFYAIWKKYYQIEFRNWDNSLLGRYPKVAEDNPVSYSPSWPAPSRPSTEFYEYEFIGWDPPLQEKARASLSYQAQYREKVLRFFTVTWMDEDGNILEKDENVPYRSIPQYNGPTPRKPGTQEQYYFCGWDPEPAPLTGDAVYIARFSTVPADVCIVTFEGDGGYLVPSPQPVLRNDRARKPERDPLKDGYEFAGWLLQDQPYDFSQPVLNSLTLTASWNKVGYAFTEGSGQTWSSASEEGASFTVSRNLRDDRTFGLFESVSVDGESLSGLDYSCAEGSLKLYLHADRLRSLAPGSHTIRVLFADGEALGTFRTVHGLYAVSYDLGGGMLPDGKQNPAFYSEDDAFTLNNPIMEGHLFSGWLGTGLKERTITVSVPAGSRGDRHYVARWRPVPPLPPTPTPTAVPTLSPEPAPTPTFSPQPVPATGDISEPILWIILLLLGAGSLAAFLFRKK